MPRRDRGATHRTVHVSRQLDVIIPHRPVLKVWGHQGKWIEKSFARARVPATHAHRDTTAAAVDSRGGEGRTNLGGNIDAHERKVVRLFVGRHHCHTPSSGPRRLLQSPMLLVVAVLGPDHLIRKASRERADQWLWLGYGHPRMRWMPMPSATATSQFGQKRAYYPSMTRKIACMYEYGLVAKVVTNLAIMFP